MTKDLNRSNLAEVLESNSLVVVKMWAAWCGPCKLVKPVVERVSERDDTSSITFINMDIEQENNGDLIRDMGIRSIPTILFYKDGVVVDTHSGMIDENGLVDKINKSFLQEN